jgi:hypothetical protein
MATPPRQKSADRPHSQGGAQLIGWREYASLPGIGIGPVIAKIDTGARTAALHAENIDVLTKPDGRWVRFDAVVDEARHVTRRCALPLHGLKRVKNTSGLAEERFVIETDLEVAGRRWPVLITLADRGDMGMPMLIGRSAIKGRFIVHPGRSFVLSAGDRAEALRRARSGSS